MFAAIIGGGWRLFEGRRQRRDPFGVEDEEVDVGGWPTVGAAGATLVASAVVLFGVSLLLNVAAGFRRPTTGIFSWSDTATFTAGYVVIGGLVALGELRAAAALRRGEGWASFLIGLQVAAVVVPIALALVSRVASDV